MRAFRDLDVHMPKHSIVNQMLAFHALKGMSNDDGKSTDASAEIRTKQTIC